MKTTITQQNINDVTKILKKEDYTEDEKIKISIAFGSLLSKQNFKDEMEYYDFISRFENYIKRLV